MVVVVLSSGILTLIEANVSFLKHELIATPFIIITTFAALYGDYYAGFLAILLGASCLYYLNSSGWNYTLHSLMRTFEFLLASSLIYYLAWRSRDLTRDTASLEHTVAGLEVLVKKTNNESKLNKVNMLNLRKTNKQLQTVVDEIMNDKNFWNESVKNNVNKKKN